MSHHNHRLHTSGLGSAEPMPLAHLSTISALTLYGTRKQYQSVQLAYVPQSYDGTSSSVKPVESPTQCQKGFTLIELLISMFIISVLTTTFITFFNTSINQYLSLHRDSLAFSDLATQSQRVGNVVRGLTDITAASNNEMTMYAYFAPDDTYVSLIRYYLTNSNTKMVADVTQMTADPPIGTPISGSMKTFNIIDNFYLSSSLNTFVYYDSASTLLTPPISDLHTIKTIKINLAVPSKAPVATSNTTMSVQVSLRNRKTNL